MDNSSSPASDAIVQSSTPFHAFAMSFVMILVSEIGDKTFLIAAIMAMRHPRLLIFAASIAALIVMTLLSVAIGYEAPQLLPEKLISFIAAGSFLFFGVKTVYEGYIMSEEQGTEELIEVEAELEAKDKGVKDLEVGESSIPEKGTLSETSMRYVNLVLSPVFVQTFLLIFIAEWGDRSQFATIALAASQNVSMVLLGTILGHGICTGVAVISGKLLASKISLRKVTIIGGLVFIIFGILSLFTKDSYVSSEDNH